MENKIKQKPNWKNIIIPVQPLSIGPSKNLFDDGIIDERKVIKLN
jgi:hypothetical protein